MPHGTASRPDRPPSPRAPRALALALVVPALAACPGNGDDDLDGDGGLPGNCERDTSTSPSAAIALGADPVLGMLCPTGDLDWYSLDVPAGSDLLDVSVTYPASASLTRVDLAVQLLEADGATPVPGASAADTKLDDGKSGIVTTFKIAAAARYVLLVRDASDDESDAVNYYSLATALATDPDGHEPNDTPATASSPDGEPAWIAYEGDLDHYRIDVPAGSGLVRIGMEVPADAGALAYQVVGPDGIPLSDGLALPGVPLDTLRAAGAPGAHAVVVSAAEGVTPDRRPEAAYRVTLEALAEPDPHDAGARNDTGATATCLGGGPGTCTAFSGSTLAYPVVTGRIASAGDRDVYRLDVASGAPAVVEIGLVMDAASGVDPAIELWTPEPSSTCTEDADCVAVNLSCAADRDCELSHYCLPEDRYAFCNPGESCRRCAGASACAPAADAGGARVCAMVQYTERDWTAPPPSSDVRDGVVRTAQPLLAPGPYYVVVRDFQDDAFDYDRSYQLTVRVLPEPDAADADAAVRNNFYEPYPLQSTDLAPQRPRALDIDAAIVAGTPISGYLSYEADQDWFSFRHPCPGADCGLQFEWTQPGPSPVRPAFLMYTSGLSLHQSWVWAGDPTSLSGPVTQIFGDGDCRECSYGSAEHGGGDPEWRYYLQVRDVGMDSWHGAGGAYQFRLVSTAAGCPAQCSNHPAAACACYCTDVSGCPGVEL